MAAKYKKMEKTRPSSICRVNKHSNYTVMSNHHLRSMNLSLKAIGLLCKILSLPPDWDYSVAGLAAICKEKQPTIKSALAELKDWGYLEVTKLMPDQTKSGRIEYVYDFYEYSAKDVPQTDDDDNQDGDVSDEETLSEKKGVSKGEKQGIEKQHLENQAVENMDVETPIRKNQVKKNKTLSNQTSINQSRSGRQKSVEDVETSDDGRMDGYVDEKAVYTDVVKRNIDFSYFAEWLNDEDEAEEIVQMIVRQICSRKPTERICRQEFPREVVKSAMLKVDIYVLENAIEQMKRVDNVRNYESYLISILFNEANGKRFRDNAESRWAEYAVKRDFGGYDD